MLQKGLKMLVEGVSFFVGLGFVPCLLFGVIIFISFLTCDYIEKFVMRTFCTFKNRRRWMRDRDSERNNSKCIRSKQSDRAEPRPGCSRDTRERERKLEKLLQMTNLEHSRPETAISVTDDGAPMFNDAPPAYNDCVPLYRQVEVVPSAPKSKSD